MIRKTLGGYQEANKSSLRKCNLDHIVAPLGFPCIPVEHSETSLAASPFLHHRVHSVQTFASFPHRRSRRYSISQAHLTPNLFHLTSEEPSFPVPSANNATDIGNIVTAAHDHSVHLIHFPASDRYVIL